MYKEPDFQPTREKLFQIIKDNIHPLQMSEFVSVQDANRRILAEDTYAFWSLPNRPVSAFDGISVRFSDFEGGMPDMSRWKEGMEFRYSNTGVAIEDGYDTVIAIEDVEKRDDGGIRIVTPPKATGEYVSPVGSQFQQGELIAHQGEVVTPQLIGMLLSAGITDIKVKKRPVVTFIPTGDELVPAGFDVYAGKNVESNSAMLRAYAREWDCDFRKMSIIPDHPWRLLEAMKFAVENSDLVLICAGSSKGSHDYTIEVLEQVGTILVQEVGYGPGKHVSLTMAGNIPIVGLPGPAGGAFLGAELCVRHVIECLKGQPFHEAEQVEATLMEDVAGKWIDFLVGVRLEKSESKSEGESVDRKALASGTAYRAYPIGMGGRTRAESYAIEDGFIYQIKGEDLKAGSTVIVELKHGKEYLK